VNNHIFAGLFGLSTMLQLSEEDRKTALKLDGATLFDPMGDGRARSDKVMLPAAMMHRPNELRAWIRRAFDSAAALSPKKKARAKKKSSTRGAGTKR
jgi:hypothetical protein